MIRVTEKRPASFGWPGVPVLIGRSAPRQQEPAFERDRYALDHLDARAAGLDRVAIGKRSPQPGRREGDGNRNINTHLVGKAKTIERLEIRWPSGTVTELADVEINRHLVVREP